MHPMSDGSDAPELWAPDWGDEMNMGERFLLVMFERWADGRGAVRGTIEEFAKRMRIGASTARGYLSTLVRLGFVTRPARGRLDDGTLTPYCHWLNLEKLGNRQPHRQNSAVADAASAPVGNSASEPPPELSGGQISHRQNSASSAETQQPPPELSGGETGGDITTGARAGAQARAAFPLPSSSYFLSFAWRDAETQTRAARILAACGPMLGKLGEQGNRVLMSLAYVLDGLWDSFDFERDVLPVVARKTGPGRRSALWDFALLTENIEAHRAKRLRDEEAVVRRAAKAASAGAAKASASKGDGARGARGGELDRMLVRGGSDAQARERRIAAVRQAIALIEAGERPMFYLPNDDRRLSGEWLDDAFARVLAEKKAELQQLLVEVEDGGGDGAQG